MDTEGQTVKTGLLRALRRLLQPLVLLLMKQGISCGEFIDVLKQVYVEVAMRDFPPHGNKRTSQARTAILTGLTRKEVKRIIVNNLQNHSDDLESRSSLNRMGRVLAAWHVEPAFTGPYGVPLELRYEDDRPDTPTFVNLVKRFSGDMPPRAMLDELKRVGAVSEEETGHIRALRRDYEPLALAPNSLDRLGKVIRNFIATQAHNLEKKAQSAGYFERQVYAEDGINKSDLEEFDKYIKEQGLLFLEQLDNWLQARKKPRSDQKDDIVYTGLGLYHWVRETESEQSFRDWLLEEGKQSPISSGPDVPAREADDSVPVLNVKKK